mgnify:CR=1 FL=1
MIYGASRSKGGRPIIAVSSTASVKGQSISRIVPMLKQGAGVVTSRIEALGKNQRVEEIARMLGGVEITEITRQHASELLRRPA